MSHGRPRRRERHVYINVVDLAIDRATLLTPAEIEQIIDPLRAAMRALREGVATETDWSFAASAVNVAKAIEHQGVVRGLSEHLHVAELALQGIQARAMSSSEWQPTALYYQELDTLTNLVELHVFQLQQLSFGEFRRALVSAVDEVRSTGGRVINVAPAAPRMAA